MAQQLAAVFRAEKGERGGERIGGEAVGRGQGDLHAIRERLAGARVDDVRVSGGRR